MGENQPGPKLGKKLLLFLILVGQFFSPPFTFYAPTTLKFRFKLIVIRYINLMKFSAVALRAGSISSSAIVP